MLTSEQLRKLIAKKELGLGDEMLMLDHASEIEKIIDTHEDLPMDVILNLQADLNLLTARLNEEYEKQYLRKEKKHLTLVE